MAFRLTKRDQRDRKDRREEATNSCPRPCLTPRSQGHKKNTERVAHHSFCVNNIDKLSSLLGNNNNSESVEVATTRRNFEVTISNTAVPLVEAPTTAARDAIVTTTSI